MTEEENVQDTTSIPTFVPTMSPTFGFFDVGLPTVPSPSLLEPVLEPTFGDEGILDGPTFEPTSSGSAFLGVDGPTMEPAEPFLVSVVPSCSVNNTCGICEGEAFLNVLRYVQWIKVHR